MVDPQSPQSWPSPGGNSTNPPGPVAVPPPPPQRIVIQQAPPPRPRGRWLSRLVFAALMISIFFNFSLMGRYQSYFSEVADPLEKFHSGDKLSTTKIAIVKVEGTIMGPSTKRILRAIKQAREDDTVEGVVLLVDSPGGLVADSHQIYNELLKLSHKKMIAVAMTRLAASGGYYVAMGAGPKGRIFAEPTTWTGSIGVILPHFDLSGLAEKVGISSDSLTTGEFKDTLNPLRKMTDREKQLWSEILDDSYQRFVTIIDESRENLDRDAVKKLATGQIYTADQAVKNGLVDEIGYLEDAINYLETKLNLSGARVISYEAPPTLWDALSQGSESKSPEAQWRSLIEATVPRAMYLCSWLPMLPEY